MIDTLAVVGGGFSGAIAAVHALRAAHGPSRIELLEPRAMLGAGLAYSTPYGEHRLNVPSRRMIVFDEKPSDFHDWFIRTGLDRSDPGSLAGDGRLFAGRRDFARYMVELLEDTQRSAARPCAVRHRRTLAVDVARGAAGRWRLSAADGSAFEADAVLVCIGHTGSTPPAPFADAALAGTGRVLTDPWDAEALSAFGPDARVLILGQGLTMGDVLSSLEARGHRGPVVAVSRRGLLARVHRECQKTPVAFESLPDEARASAVVRLMREACEAAVRAGHSWNSVIETTRERGGRLWQRLPVGEQCRLIRHARIFWDVHRYRMAPQVADTIERARAAGRLRLLAGRVFAAAPVAGGDGIEVLVRRHPRDGSRILRERFDVVVSCVGPTHDTTTIDNPFIRALLRRGLAEPHPTRLGFVVGRDNVLMRAGSETPGLHVVGPLSRGACGDIVGVPEISRQVRAVIDSLSNGPATTGRMPAGDGMASSSVAA